MPREKENYRETLAYLMEATGGKTFLAESKVATMLRKDVRTLRKDKNFVKMVKPGIGISVYALARYLS